MGRALKRVPLDFQWPIDKTWWGYLSPEDLREGQCSKCGGSGLSTEAKYLQEKWYGNAPFEPSETGSEPFEVEEPAIWGRAMRNTESDPGFYGAGEAALRREALRLAELFNGAWSHHLSQDDVDALVAAGRLHDFTHEWSKESGWTPKDPMPQVQASDVNRWSLTGLSHDSSNAYVVIRALCERQELPVECSECKGHGCVEKFLGQRREAERWEPTEPPTGEGWQVWETVSEGSPITPVFATPEALVDHLVMVGAWNKKWERETAERFVHGSGWAPSGTAIGGTFYTPENQP